MCYTIQAPDAGVAEQADARDLKSRGINFPYRFDPGFRHQAGQTKIGLISRSRAEAARRAHNPEVAGSIPVSATKGNPCKSRVSFFFLLFLFPCLDGNRPVFSAGFLPVSTVNGTKTVVNIINLDTCYRYRGLVFYPEELSNSAYPTVTLHCHINKVIE